MNYIQEMKDKAKEGFDALHRDIISLAFVDFPDHSNVGDSAIALGQFQYWRESAISVEAVRSGADLTHADARTYPTIAIHGGGNLGGLYRPMENRRNRLAQYLPSETILLQLPQSVVFVDEEARELYARSLGSRPKTRVAARDSDSFEELQSCTSSLFLVPDSIHHLGYIDSPAPVDDLLVLARTDKESAQQLTSSVPAVDWHRGTFLEKVIRKVKYSTELPQPVRHLMHKSPESWFDAAQNRFDAGVHLLSGAETIVTDRLHAMLIGLQMGRTVVAVDNSNSKLSNYANTWFKGIAMNLEFASDFDEAIRIAKRKNY